MITRSREIALRGDRKPRGTVEGFAAAVEPVELREERAELLREAVWSLREWDRHRLPEDRARCLAALESITRLMRAAA